MKIEAIAAWPHRALHVMLELSEGSTVADALARIPQDMREDMAGVAIHGVAVKETHVLEEADRLELLRALVVDPKTARRLRAHTQHARGTG